MSVDESEQRATSEQKIKEEFSSTSQKFLATPRRSAMRIVFPKVLIELRPSPLDGVGVFAVTPLKTDQRIAAGIADRITVA